jgi:hypothetical protein
VLERPGAEFATLADQRSGFKRNVLVQARAPSARLFPAAGAAES